MPLGGTGGRGGGGKPSSCHHGCRTSTGGPEWRNVVGRALDAQLARRLGLCGRSPSRHGGGKRGYRVWYDNRRRYEGDLWSPGVLNLVRVAPCKCAGVGMGVCVGGAQSHIPCWCRWFQPRSVGKQKSITITHTVGRCRTRDHGRDKCLFPSFSFWGNPFTMPLNIDCSSSSSSSPRSPYWMITHQLPYDHMGIQYLAINCEAPDF